jgi:haloacetate dehalogenase
MLDNGRRDLLKKAAFGVGAIASAGNVLPGAGQVPDQAEQNATATDFFPGFKRLTVKTSGATINLVTGGQGPGLLLLHGYPQTHIIWRKVAPQLAQEFTLVMPDLRGYGDSSKPPDGENHSGYSKRAMALDQVEVMASLGFEKFPVVGHDRGGRVGQRMALDHPDRVEKLTVLDIVPTYKLFRHVTKEWATASYHWFFLIQPAPLPETLIGNSVEVWVNSQCHHAGEQPPADKAHADVMSKEALAEYVRCFRNPGMIHAGCEDYRAGASIDLIHDAADIDRNISCPVLVLWADRSAIHRLYNVLDTWRERAPSAHGKAIPSGHFIPEERPDILLAELKTFLR